MGCELGEGKAGIEDLRHMDKGVQFIAGVEGRPGGEGSGRISQTGGKGGDSETEHGGDDKVELKWLRVGVDKGGLA